MYEWSVSSKHCQGSRPGIQVIFHCSPYPSRALSPGGVGSTQMTLAVVRATCGVESVCGEGQERGGKGIVFAWYLIQSSSSVGAGHGRRGQGRGAWGGHTFTGGSFMTSGGSFCVVTPPSPSPAPYSSPRAREEDLGFVTEGWRIGETLRCVWIHIPRDSGSKGLYLIYNDELSRLRFYPCS